MKIGGLQKISLIDYPKEICAIVFTYGCNFRCPYCHNPELITNTTTHRKIVNDELGRNRVISDELRIMNEENKNNSKFKTQHSTLKNRDNSKLKIHNSTLLKAHNSTFFITVQTPLNRDNLTGQKYSDKFLLHQHSELFLHKAG